MVELATIMREAGPAYRDRFGPACLRPIAGRCVTSRNVARLRWAVMSRSATPVRGSSTLITPVATGIARSATAMRREGGSKRRPLVSHIERFEADEVTFRYRDSKTKQTRRCTLPSHEFLARFLQHVLPRGFTKVRYYGLLSSPSKQKLEKAHAILEGRAGVAKLEQPCLESQIENPSEDGDQKEAFCASCKAGRMRVVAKFPRRWKPP